MMSEDLKISADNIEKYQVVSAGKWHGPIDSTDIPQYILSTIGQIEQSMSDAVKITWIICGTVLVLAAMIILFRY